MKMSENVGELIDALAKAQGEFLPVKKDASADVKNKEGKFLYKFDYATLDEIIASVRPALNKHGIFLCNPAFIGEGVVRVSTRLMLKDQWIEFDNVEFTTERIDPQALGSLETYARRYSTCPSLGITAETDDDGNAASGNQRDNSKREPQKPQQRTAADDGNDKLNEPPKSHANGNGAAKATKPTDKTGPGIFGMALKAIAEVADSKKLLEYTLAIPKRLAAEAITKDEGHKLFQMARERLIFLDETTRVPADIANEIASVIEAHIGAADPVTA